MNPRRAFIFVIVLGAAALVYVAARYARESPPAEAEAAAPAGDRVSVRLYRNPATVGDFTVRDLEGRTISSASLRGKVTVINFWATWCGPCRSEIPELIEFQKHYADELVVVGLSIDEGSPADVKKFTKPTTGN
jgi:thiol-disulfide isomerase/thioredoxin